MLLSRCAWHPRYFGYPFIGGIASWAGWSLKFTDGICTECATRFRAEYQAFFEERRRLEAAHDVETQRQVA